MNSIISHVSDRVRAPIRYELATNGLTFPHIYGPLNLDAVTGVQDFEPRDGGMFAVPD